MTKRRAIKWEEVKARRANGETWQQVAKALRWNASHLRRRALEEGFLDEPGAAPIVDQDQEKEAPKKQRLGDQVAELARLGATLEQVVIVTGKSQEAIIKAIKCPWPDFTCKCQLVAKVELARAIYAKALAGDRAAFNRWQRGLLD